ncbi:MAG: hypothetical protein R2939_00375 [Kofleriaceae bacterium]
MSLPRQVLPAGFHLITRRCTQRQYIFRPDAQTNNNIVYCLAEAARRFGIDVLLTVFESNHHHTLIFDRHGRYPEFLQHFHKMLARCQNALRRRWENLWSSDAPCVTRLLDRATVIAKLIYAASNPVKDGLVERATQWPGVNAYRELLSGRPLTATRPRHFFRDRGVMPAEVSLSLSIPAELGDPDDVIAEVEAGVREIEEERRRLRAATGARVLGRRAILAQRWFDAPTDLTPFSRPAFASLGLVGAGVRTRSA